MDEDHILKVNPGKLMRCLAGVLSAAELDKIRQRLDANVRELVKLSEAHLRFATHASGRGAWRQRVSRAYYACYIASRAIRLACSGHYDTDPQDHKKIGDLPGGFPSKATWAEFLTKFKGDRNLADYDHSVEAADLELRPAEYVGKARAFVGAVKAHLKGKGVL